MIIHTIFRCLDQIHLLPHLKDAVVSDGIQVDDVICSQNVSKFTANGSYNYKPTIKDVQLLNIDKPNNHSSAIEFKSEVTNQTNLSTVDLLTENALKSNGQMLWSPLLQNIAPSLYHHRRSTLNRSYFYSSGNIFAIRLVYGKIEKIENASNFHFYINGNFRFLNKCR